MSKENSEQALPNTSVEILLAEHQRLATLYLHNAEMGEKRTTSHLTLVSVGTALLAGLAQMQASQGFLLWTSFGLVSGVFIFGLLTFQRLLERRIRAIEYLRAINRIHRFFVRRDPTIRDYFYWSACDDVPTFLARGTVLTGLRDLVACFNSLFAGIATGEMMRIKWGDLISYPKAVGAGLIVSVVIWVLHQFYERRILNRIEKKAAEGVRFPRSNDMASRAV